MASSSIPSEQSDMKLFKTIVAIVLAATCARADTVVAPTSNTTLSGDNSIHPGFASPSSYQLVFGSKNFAGPVAVTGLSFRQDEDSLGGSFEVMIPRVIIQFSTYHGTVASFQATYDQNKGPDDTTVYDAAADWRSTDLFGSQPNPFEIKVQFSKPFVYDAATGPLLMYYQSFGPYSGGGVAADAQGTPVDGGVGWYGDRFGVTFEIPVTQFDVTPVPEPLPLCLVIFSIPLFGLIRRRR